MSFPGFAARYAWCVLCERVYPAIVWVDSEWQCPNPACDGGPDDVWEYGPGSSLLREHPQYPVEPQVGERLPV